MNGLLRHLLGLLARGLRLMGDRLSTFSAPQLAEEAVEVAPVEPETGPPAHWLELVRRRAPGLYQRLRERGEVPAPTAGAPRSVMPAVTAPRPQRPPAAAGMAADRRSKVVRAPSSPAPSVTVGAGPSVPISTTSATAGVAKAPMPPAAVADPAPSAPVAASATAIAGPTAATTGSSVAAAAARAVPRPSVAPRDGHPSSTVPDLPGMAPRPAQHQPTVDAGAVQGPPRTGAADPAAETRATPMMRPAQPAPTIRDGRMASSPGRSGQVFPPLPRPPEMAGWEHPLRLPGRMDSTPDIGPLAPLLHDLSQDLLGRFPALPDEPERLPLRGGEAALAASTPARPQPRRTEQPSRPQSAAISHLPPSGREPNTWPELPAEQESESDDDGLRLPPGHRERLAREQRGITWNG
jgi:hypothetical protein